MQEIREFAPIIIPTLNRYEHLKRCVESLAKCTHADKTELVIGLDYPPSEKYVEGWIRVKDYVSTIHGFKTVTILSANTNLGFTKNWRKCIDYVFQKYDTYIFSEDDNEFSPCFLDYADKALTRYWDDTRVSAVCGYNFPVNMSNYDKNIYFHHQFSAWGVARWKHKYYSADEQLLYKILHSPSKIYKILRVESKVLTSLMNMSMKGTVYADALNVSLNICDGKFIS